MKEQLKVKPFNSPDCQYKTKRKHYLTIHIEQVHSRNLARDFPCITCHKTFKWKASLEIHKKTIHIISSVVTEEQESVDIPSEPKDGSTESTDKSRSEGNTEMESPSVNTEEPRPEAFTSEPA